MQKNCTVAGCRSLIRKKNTDMVNGSAYLLLLLPLLVSRFSALLLLVLAFSAFFFFSFPLPFLVSLQPNRSFLLFSLFFFFFLGGGCEGFDSKDENFWEKNYVTWRVVQFRRVYDFVCNRWSSETIVIRRACGFEAKVHWL